MTFKTISRVLFALGAMALLPLSLSGCADFDDEGQDEDLSSPLPSDQAEVAPVLENPTTQIWRPGYWAPGTDIKSGSFVWVPGEVLPRPYPTAVWTPARWVRHVYGWSFQEGHWQ